MLDPVPQLSGDLFGDVDRILGHEEHADTLRSHQPHDLFDLVHQRPRRIIEQQMRLVEEEDELRPVGIAHFGQRLEQFGEQPQQEGRIKLGRAHQPVRCEDVDPAAPFAVHAHEIGDFEGRLAEKQVRALAFESEQLALDRPDALARNIAVSEFQLRRILAHREEDAAQIAEIEQQKAIIVGPLEGDRKYAFLGVVEIEQSRQQQRAHLGNRGADRVALLSEQVPQHGGIAFIVEILDPQLGDPGFDLVGMLERRTARHGDPGKVALHIGGEDGDACARELLGHRLESHRLAGAGRAGDHAVAIGLVEPKILRRAVRRLAKEDIAHIPLHYRAPLCLGDCVAARGGFCKGAIAR